MADDGTRAGLLDEPELRPFLPLLWVAWSDGDLEADELAAIRERVEQMPWLRPRVRLALERWLDPAAPPAPNEVAKLLETVKAASGTLPPERRHDLAALGRALADGTSDATEREEVGRALTELEEQLGGLSSLSPPGSVPVAPGVSEVAPFDVTALGRVLDGGEGTVRAAIRAFLDDPGKRVYGVPLAEHRAKVRGWLDELAKLGFGTYAFPGITNDIPDLGAFVAAFETLAMGDLSLVVRFGVQFGLFGGSIYFLGTEAQRRELLPAVVTLENPGCFAMSEVGHGSDVANLETVARWQPETRTFVIHTPSEAARKDWIGGAAVHARTATVFAQLEAHGQRQGVHAFVVPIRDADGALLPGVRAGDSGLKMGLNGVDNGRLWFDEVVVPETALLARFAKMNAEGAYESAIENPSRRFFTMLGTLVGGRVSVASAAVSGGKVALAIAVRYASVRRPFGAGEASDRALLTYPTHGSRLLVPLATTYVHTMAVGALRRKFAETQMPFAGITDPPRDTRVLEAEAAALKVLTTKHAVRTARACREACGGQGYLAVNRLPDLCADLEIFTTFEGDNTILLQLVAKSLLSEHKRRFDGAGVGAVVRHIAGRAMEAALEKNPLDAFRVDPNVLRSRGFHLAALRFRERQLLVRAVARIRKRLGEKMPPDEAMLEVQEHLVVLAEAYAERLALTFFDEEVTKVADEGVRAELDRLGALHGVELLRRDAAFYLQEGYFDAERASELRVTSERLRAELVPRAVGLVDAFGIPATCLAAPIAFMDPANPVW